jgi:hypothetical protein
MRGGWVSQGWVCVQRRVGRTDGGREGGREGEGKRREGDE